MSGALRLYMLWAFIGVSVYSQVLRPGKCPEVKGMDPFDVNEYMGRWYEIKKYPAIFEAGGKCMNADYSLREDGKVRVINRSIKTVTNEPSSIEGVATLLAPGELNVQFPTSGHVTSGANYIVLDTDYENYVVVFSCTPTGTDSNAQFAWILSKHRYPSDEAITRAEQIFDANHISREYLTVTDQNGCTN